MPGFWGLPDMSSTLWWEYINLLRNVPFQRKAIIVYISCKETRRQYGSPWESSDRYFNSKRNYWADEFKENKKKRIVPPRRARTFKDVGQTRTFDYLKKTDLEEMHCTPDWKAGASEKVRTRFSKRATIPGCLWVAEQRRTYTFLCLRRRSNCITCAQYKEMPLCSDQ